MTKSGGRIRRMAGVWLAGWMGLSAAWSQVPEREQVVELRAGWNAVYLEVNPAEPEPEKVFAGLPVDQVAAHLRPVTSAQFVVNPGVDLFRKSGWAVWYAPGREDHFLTTLHAVHGPGAYLIHATEAATWRVRGGVVIGEIRWQPDAFNFVGFSVRPQGGPTFSQFFGGSVAHRGMRIHRLTDGVWREVADPSAETLRSGEAFWVYTKGRSVFQGPLQVDMPTRQGLVLAGRPAGVVLRNATDHPVTAVVEHVPGEGGGVALSMVLRGVGSPSAMVRTVSAPKPAGSWVQGLPPLEAGAYVRVPMEWRPSGVEDLGGGTTLLKITSDLGTETWVPVFILRKDVRNP